MTGASRAGRSGDLMVSMRTALVAATASFVIGGAIVGAIVFETLGANTKAMKACPTDKVVTHVVRVVIPKDWDPNTPVRHVTWKPYGEYERATDDDSPDNGGTKIPPPDPQYPDRFPFHVNVMGIGDSGDKKKHIEVRVVLRDGDFSFGRLPDENNKWIEGVGKSLPRGKVKFCGASISRTSSGVPVASFFVRARKKSTVPSDGGYNIILLPAGDEGTPLLIDPHVRNNG